MQWDISHSGEKHFFYTQILYADQQILKAILKYMLLTKISFKKLPIFRF